MGYKRNIDFLKRKCMLCVLIRIASSRRFLWVHTIHHFLYKGENHPKLSQICSFRIFFQGTQERVRSSRGKRAISVRATKVLLYIRYIEHIGDQKSGLWDKVSYQGQTSEDGPECHSSEASICQNIFFFFFFLFVCLFFDNVDLCWRCWNPILLYQSHNTPNLILESTFKHNLFAIMHSQQTT